jgi:phage repressor protein C with HTH and peptisase S24 domain
MGNDIPPTFCCRMSGDKMSPRFEDGDLLLAEQTNRSRACPGNHCVVTRNDGSRFCRTLQSQDKRGAIFEAVNKEVEPEPTFVWWSDVAAIHRVVAVLFPPLVSIAVQLEDETAHA